MVSIGFNTSESIIDKKLEIEQNNPSDFPWIISKKNNKWCFQKK